MDNAFYADICDFKEKICEYVAQIFKYSSSCDARGRLRAQSQLRPRKFVA